MKSSPAFTPNLNVPTKKKRITFVVNSITKKGGTELYVRSTILALQEIGIECQVIITSLDDDDVRFMKTHHIPHLLLDRLAGDSKNPSKIRQTYQQSILAQDFIFHNQSNIVIIHCYSPNFGMLMKSISRKVKTILFVHTPTFTCPAGGRYLPHSERFCESVPGLSCFITNQKEACISINFNGRLPLSYVPDVVFFRSKMQRFLTYFDKIVANSSDTLEELRKLYDLPQTSIVHPPLIPGSLIGLTRNETYSTDFRKLIFIGRLERYKGCKDALQVLASLPKDYTLDIYGSGSEEIPLKNLATQLGIEDRIRWHGWVSQEAVFHGLSQSMICLVPSKGVETFGQIGPQAIFFGNIVIAYDSGGIKDWCTPDVGSLVPVGNWCEMSKQVLIWTEKIQEGYQIPYHRIDQWRAGRFVEDIKKCILSI